MSAPRIIDCADVRVTITAPVAKQCPVKNEPDHGTLKVTYRTNGKAIELHHLADYLAGFADKAISHEDFTDTVAQEFGVKVETTWLTAGLTVTVTSR